MPGLVPAFAFSTACAQRVFQLLTGWRPPHTACPLVLLCGRCLSAIAAVFFGVAVSGFFAGCSEGCAAGPCLHCRTGSLVFWTALHPVFSSLGPDLLSRAKNTQTQSTLVVDTVVRVWDGFLSLLSEGPRGMLKVALVVAPIVPALQLPNQGCIVQQVQQVQLVTPALNTRATTTQPSLVADTVVRVLDRVAPRAAGKAFVATPGVNSSSLQQAPAAALSLRGVGWTLTGNKTPLNQPLLPPCSGDVYSRGCIAEALGFQSYGTGVLLPPPLWKWLPCLLVSICWQFFRD